MIFAAKGYFGDILNYYCEIGCWMMWKHNRTWKFTIRDSIQAQFLQNGVLIFSSFCFTFILYFDLNAPHTDRRLSWYRWLLAFKRAVNQYHMIRWSGDMISAMKYIKMLHTRAHLALDVLGRSWLQANNNEVIGFDSEVQSILTCFF